MCPSPKPHRSLVCTYDRSGSWTVFVTSTTAHRYVGSVTCGFYEPVSSPGVGAQLASSLGLSCLLFREQERVSPATPLAVHTDDEGPRPEQVRPPGRLLVVVPCVTTEHPCLCVFSTSETYLAFFRAIVQTPVHPRFGLVPGPDCTGTGGPGFPVFAPFSA